MKDFYRKLGIEPDASTAEIREALEKKPELDGVTDILLDEDRREGYDEAHAALRAIGVMRHQLGLDSGDTWFVENYPDFAPRLFLYKASTFPKPETAVQPADKNYELEPYQRTKHRRRGRSNTPVIVTVVVAVIVLAILAFKYF